MFLNFVVTIIKKSACVSTHICMFIVKLNSIEFVQ